MALAIRCDVADDAQVEAMVEQTVATFGRLDAAYNNAGVQNVLAETADQTREDFDWVTGINLHLMWREPEREVLPVCEELGIGFVPYSPVNRGFLGGNLNEYTRFDSGNDNRNTLPRFTPEAMRANLAIVEVLNRFGRTRGATSAQVALAWLLAKQPWIMPIPGTTKLAHLEENLRAADLKLSAGDMSEVEGAVSKIEIVGARYPAEQQEQISRE